MGERPTSFPRRALALFAVVLVTAPAAVGLAACGDEPRQDEGEPAGDFQVDVTRSKFPSEQRLADTSDLILGVRNTGTETIPELAFTIETDDGNANGSFSIQVDNENLADPNRPVWVLENKFPRELGTPPPSGLSGGLRAQTNTYAFGPLEPGEERTIVWRLTPVQAGTYTLHYIVEAGLHGKAKAVTRDGGEVKGEFVVTISDKPPSSRVNDAGQVITKGD